MGKYQYIGSWLFFLPFVVTIWSTNPKVSFRAIEEEKSKEKRLPQKWPFWGEIHSQGNLGHFLPFSHPPPFSRGLHWYGMILLYFWVRFSHFPPLVDFFLSLKSPSLHMWSAGHAPIFDNIKQKTHPLLDPKFDPFWARFDSFLTLFACLTCACRFWHALVTHICARMWRIHKASPITHPYLQEALHSDDLWSAVNTWSRIPDFMHWPEFWVPHRRDSNWIQDEVCNSSDWFRWGGK